MSGLGLVRQPRLWYSERRGEGGTVKKDKLSARGLEIEFEDGLGEEVTAHAGVALLVEVGRRSGVIATADRVHPAKKNPKGLTQGQMVARPPRPSRGRAAGPGSR